MSITAPVYRLGEMSAAAGGRLLEEARTLLYRTPLYGLLLHGPMPDQLVAYPADVREGKLEEAERLLEGRYRFAGRQVEAPGVSVWRTPPPSDAWAEALHGFAWLGHLSAAGNGTARLQARQLISEWTRLCTRWHPVAWRPHVIGRRLISWLTSGPLLFEDAELVYRSAALVLMARQARHLRRTARRAPPGIPRLTAAAGLFLSGICLSEGERRLHTGSRLLHRELDAQILPDGGHVSRNPTMLLDILADLLILRRACLANRYEVPEFLQNAIDRMMPMLRFFRHGDGKLALFNGSYEGEARQIEAVLAEDDAQGRPLGHAPHSGYQRIETERSILLMDTGGPPPSYASAQAHAGCLSFELSTEGQRLIVNCGPSHGLNGAWQTASRATAAHSTLTVADTSSARMLSDGAAKRVLGPRLVSGPQNVTRRCSEEGGILRLKTSHDGYEARFGLRHERQVFIDKAGTVLQGIDRLRETRRPSLPWKDPPLRPFAIRFHLHPGIRASLAQDNTRALLRLPNGTGWQLEIRGGTLSLEDSIYFGEGEKSRRCEQLVISGVFKPPKTEIFWRLAAIRRNGQTEGATAGRRGKTLPPLGDKPAH